MNKSILIFFAFVFFPLICTSQVGINTVSPMATLHVDGKPNVVGELDGIIPPKLTGTQLQAKTYSSNQNGAIVYVTQVASFPSGQTVNVKAVGLYLFNSNINEWIMVTPSLSLKNVFSNSNDPNTATVFDDELPVVTNDLSLIENSQYTYFGLDGSVWVWDGTDYVSFNNNLNMNVGQRVSVYRNMLNSVANNTILPASGLIELDGLIRIDLRKVSNTYYSPRILNISGSSINLTYQTFASQTNQNEDMVSGSLASGSSYEVDADNLIYWTTTATEVVSSNIVLSNGRWYEVQWYAYEKSLSKHIFITVERKF